MGNCVPSHCSIEWGTIWGRFLYQVDKTGIISPSFHTFDWENYYVQNVCIPTGTKAGQVFAHQAPTKVSIQPHVSRVPSTGSTQYMYRYAYRYPTLVRAACCILPCTVQFYRIHVQFYRIHVRYTFVRLYRMTTH